MVFSYITVTPEILLIEWQQNHRLLASGVCTTEHRCVIIAHKKTVFLCFKGNHSISGYHQPGNVNVSYVIYLHL